MSISVLATVLAIPAVIVALRKTPKENVAGRKQIRRGLILAGVTAALMLVGFALLQGLNRTHEGIYRVKCQVNETEIAEALLRYANDHNDQFPQGFAQLIAGDYVSPQRLVCDSTNDQYAAGPTTQQTLADFAKPGRCSYIYLGAGQSRSSVSKDFVLAYEPLENHEKEERISFLAMAGWSGWRAALRGR